ncbi:MAG: hypothetical protein RIC14_00675 [Filomicrobium sp.]
MPETPLTEIITSGDATDFTDDHIRQFRDNPALLDLIGDRETLNLRNLWRILWIAAALVAVSKGLAITYGDEYDQFVFAVLSDLVFEMGAALIGSVATVIFIQYQEKRQFEENMRFRAEIRRRIELLEDTEQTSKR